MSEIAKDRAFNTIKNLSKKLEFEPPKEENRLLFEKQAYANLYNFFPIILILKVQGCEIHLIITNSMGSKEIDLTQMLIPLSYQNNPNLESCKVCVKSHKEAQKISANLEQIQKELISTLDTLLQIVETKKSHAITENDILEYFAQHLQLAKDFKKICDKDLQSLRYEQPEIIESWKYYQVFEYLCKTLD